MISPLYLRSLDVGITASIALSPKIYVFTTNYKRSLSLNRKHDIILNCEKNFKHKI